jgi:hypothetical protein
MYISNVRNATLARIFSRAFFLHKNFMVVSVSIMILLFYYAKEGRLNKRSLKIREREKKKRETEIFMAVRAIRAEKFT